MPEELLNSVNAESAPTVEAQTEQTTEPAAPVESVPAEPAIQPTEPKAAQTPEENAKFAALRRKYEAEKAEAEQKAKDAAAAVLAQRFKIPNVKTLEEFEKFAQEQEVQNLGVDPEKYKALRDSDPVVIEANRIKAQQAAAAKEIQALGEFRKAFSEANGREFDITKDFKVYQDVKKEAEATGKDLTDVYARQTSKALVSRLAELEAKLKAQETNAANAASSPGSVKADGQADSTVLTEEMIASMKPAELARRWPEVKSLLKMK